MKRLIVPICVAVIVLGILAGCPALPIAAAIHVNLPSTPNPRAFQRNASLASNLDRPTDASGLSCANPTLDVVRKCKELEQQILASTVRLELDLWVIDDNGNRRSRVHMIGHATIKDGRYLVTHNHWGISSSDLGSNRLNSVSIVTANGVPRLTNWPLNTITIAAEDAETLVLDFGMHDGQGMFAMMGMSSAEFKAWEPLLLKPGMQVAQVTWDGATESVDWTWIEDINTESGTPTLELDNFVRLGTSGGGVFWNGYHVANTWSQRTVLNGSNGTASHQYSIAALNSRQVAGQLK